ncbi:MAG: biotin/lipoyl-containing protein [Acidobacteriota bacterium]
MHGRIRLHYRGADGAREIVVAWTSSGAVVDDGGVRSEVDAVRLPDGRLSLLFADGRQVCGRVVAGRPESLVGRRGAIVRVPLADPRHRAAHTEMEASDASGEEVRALMPGRVVEVQVSEGDTVAAGALLLILEAMKMQNEIRASVAGRVSRLTASAGQAVEKGAHLVSLEVQP